MNLVNGCQRHCRSTVSCSRWSRAGLALLVALAANWGAAAEPRLFEAAPYDRITLKDQSVIKVSPVEFPGGRPPESAKPSDRLVVRLIDRPTEEYELHWRDIVEYRQFVRLILDEAERLTSAGNLAAAFAYFDYLERNHPSLSELKPATEKYLYEDAKDCQRRKKYAEALAVLDELHRRHPDFPGLDRAWGAATDKVLEPLVAANDFAGARLRLHNLRSRFPEEANGRKWQQLFESQAAALIAQAEAEATAGKLQSARQHVFAALERWPAHVAARKLALDLHARAPSLNVGVTQPLLPGERDPLTDWAARRDFRLTGRSLLEISGFGAEGGVYTSPLGEFAIGELGLELNVRLRPDTNRADGEPLTGYDLSQHLFQRLTSQPDSLLSQLIERVAVRGVYGVDLTLRRPHVRPEALLTEPLLMPNPNDGDWTLAAVAPYQVVEQTPQLVRYVARSSAAAVAGGGGGPSEIVEQTYPRVSAALGALERGEILVLDRLNPWDVAAASTIPGIVVEPYAVPTVHVLVPNLNNPLLAKRIFRRALVYGINREAILRVQLLRGAQLPDTRVTSGPFPLGYAYNDQVEVRPYEPRMAMTLAEIAAKELAADSPTAPADTPKLSDAAVAPQEAGGDDAEGAAEPDATPAAAAAPSMPALRLAHPPTEVARLACRAIQRQLKLVGIPIELSELTTETVAAAVASFDLVYVELQLEAPITDARRLFGAGGLASGSSPHLEEALVRLEAAADWKTAREALQRVHRIAADDVALLPLWQMGEHLAYRNSVQGIPSRPVVLYQDVNQWQAEPYLPAIP